MKPINEVLSSICETAGAEYVEVTGDKLVDTADGPFVWPAHICSIVKDGVVIIENFACTMSDQVDETTKETAREWLLLSLIIKAINQ